MKAGRRMASGLDRIRRLGVVGKLPTWPTRLTDAADIATSERRAFLVKKLQKQMETLWRDARILEQHRRYRVERAEKIRRLISEVENWQG